MLSGNWGKSYSILRDSPVSTLLIGTLPRTIDVLMLPLIIGLFLGVLLGTISIRSKFRIVNRIIQILSYLAFATPIILLAGTLQLTLGYIFPIFPHTGFKEISFPDPPTVTGFRVIDSLLSGQLELIPDYLYHLILPWISMLLSIMVFTIAITRIYLINRSKRDLDTESIAPFMVIAG